MLAAGKIEVTNLLTQESLTLQDGNRPVQVVSSSPGDRLLSLSGADKGPKAMGT